MWFAGGLLVVCWWFAGGLRGKSRAGLGVCASPDEVWCICQVMLSHIFLFRMFVLFVYGLYVSRTRSFVPGGERERPSWEEEPSAIPGMNICY